MNVLVIGTGAIGSFYGSLLARAGAQVSVVARSDYDHVSAYGIDVQSDTKLGSYHFKPVEVLRSAVELQKKPDYVLLCTKVIPGVDRVGLLREALGPQTSIVLVSNGVDVENEIAEAFPEHELISGLAFVCVTRTAAGHIWHQDYGRLVLGNYPKGVSPKTLALCEAISQSGIEAIPHETIVMARWEKCIWNAPFNPLSVLSGGLTVNEILSAQEPFVRTLMQEVCAIAQSLGYELPIDIIETRLANTRKMSPYKTSMLVDFEAGRPMEIEAILGATLKAATRAGVAVPHLDSLYALMKLRELSLRKG